MFMARRNRRALVGVVAVAALAVAGCSSSKAKTAGTADKRGAVQCRCRSVVRTSRGDKRRGIVCTCVCSCVRARRWRRARDHHDRPVRHIRLQGSRALRAIREAAPEHHHQGRRRRAVERLLQGAADPPRGRFWPRRYSGDRDRLRRRRHGEPRRPVRRLQLASRRSSAQEQLLPVEVGDGKHVRRQDRWPRHGRWSRSHVLPARPVEGRWPAIGSGRAERSVVDVAGVHRLRQAVRRENTQAVPRLCSEHLQRRSLRRAPKATTTPPASPT